MDSQEVMIERIPSSDFVYTSSDFVHTLGLYYEDWAGLHRLYDKLINHSDLLLTGPKGVGKTLSIASFAANRKIPLITCDCSEDVRRSNLIGSFVLRGNDTPFLLGPLTTAFEVANELGHCILVFEEVACLSPQMQKILNPLVDYRRRLEVPECRKVFKLRSAANLWVVGTMNSASYAGVHALNEDLKSRFRMLPVSYPAPSVEKALVRNAFKGSGLKISEKELTSVLILAHETRQKEFNYSLSTRDVFQIVTDAGLVGLKDALMLSLGKFEPEDRTTVVERIKSIFDLDLAVL